MKQFFMTGNFFFWVLLWIRRFLLFLATSRFGNWIHLKTKFQNRLKIYIEKIQSASRIRLTCYYQSLIEAFFKKKYTN